MESFRLISLNFVFPVFFLNFVLKQNEKIIKDLFNSFPFNNLRYTQETVYFSASFLTFCNINNCCMIVTVKFLSQCTRFPSGNFGRVRCILAGSNHRTKFPKACSSINGRFFDLARDFVNVLTTFSEPAFPPFGGPFKGMMDARHATRFNTPRGSMDI